MENNSKHNTEKLFDAVLKAAAHEAAKREMEGLPSREELKKLYSDPGTEDFYNKMTKKIARHERSAKIKQAKKYLYRIAASIAIIFMISFIGLMSVEASRVFILSRIIEIYDNRAYISYRFGEVSDFEAGQLYFGYLPEGFTLYAKRPLFELWEYSFSDQYGDLSLFVQHLLIEDGGSVYSTAELHPDYVEFSIIPFKGHFAYVSRSLSEGGSSSISWIYERNFILIWAWLDVEELFKIAENITVLPNAPFDR